VFSNLFYYFLWIILRLGTGFFYRDTWRKQIVGLDNIPSDKPVIFCVNHPNAFLDAIVVASSTRKRVRFLVRSDVMRNPFQRAFLSFIGLIPIYRMQEGIENLGKNDETFSECHKLLKQHKAIIIFSEGLCIQERRLRKLKKGTARIALGAEEAFDFNLDLQLVPVGINYAAHAWKFRSHLSIHFGKPIAVKNYKEAYQNEKAKAINQLTKDVEQAMAAEILVISSKEDDLLVEQLEHLAFNDWDQNAQKILDRKAIQRHERSLELVDLLSHANTHDRQELSQLREMTSEYYRRMNEGKVNDASVCRAFNLGSNSNGFIFRKNVALFLGFPLWAFGVITNYVPYQVPYRIAQKIVRNIEWHASVNVTIGVFFWLIWWLLQSLAVALIFRNWFVLFGFMLLVPIAGVFAYWCWRQVRMLAGLRRVSRAVEPKRLFQYRQQILEQLNAWRKNKSV
jgi:glycerol-3-phosphate O-acyltransferase / dihydroxyacetone phosphate acyltransferase